MAQATVTPTIPAVTKTVVVKPEQPGRVVLTLTKEEADALVCVTAYVGGCPSRTRRGLIQTIRSALRDAGVSNGGDPFGSDIVNGSNITFTSKR